MCVPESHLCYAAHYVPCHDMLCYAMLCYAMLRHAMLCHATPCYARSACAIWLIDGKRSAVSTVHAPFGDVTTAESTCNRHSE